jgi:hypothetical protein
MFGRIVIPTGYKENAGVFPVTGECLEGYTRQTKRAAAAYRKLLRAGIENKKLFKAAAFSTARQGPRSKSVSQAECRVILPHQFLGGRLLFENPRRRRLYNP